MKELSEVEGRDERWRGAIRVGEERSEVGRLSRGSARRPRPPLGLRLGLTYSRLQGTKVQAAARLSDVRVNE